MTEWPIIWEWLGFAARWLHVITAIAWIGSSFYFIALDLGLHRDRNLASGDENVAYDGYWIVRNQWSEYVSRE